MSPYPMDHLIYAAPDLESGVERLYELTGFEARSGGRHPKWGTRNAVVVLADQRYLEVVGPDPDRPSGQDVTLLGIDALQHAQLVTWAARGTGLEALRGRARTLGLDLGSVSSGVRKQPDGSVLAWTLTDPQAHRRGGVIPFFIDWGTTRHPAADPPAQGSVVALRAVHPDAARIAALVGALGLELPVDPGPAPKLVATLSTPRGVVELA